jgi:hypothetical protein
MKMSCWVWLALAALCGPVCMGNASGAGSGDDLYVGCRFVPVHERPSGYSSVAGMIEFGARVKVLELVDLVKNDDTESPGKRGKRSGENASWARVEAGNLQGYVPTRCLVTARMLRRQDPNKALGKIESKPSEVAGKGFSETEDGDLNALKGMSGQAHTAGADYEGIDRIVKSPAQYDPKDSYVDFRKEGGVGEFAERR